MEHLAKTIVDNFIGKPFKDLEKYDVFKEPQGGEPAQFLNLGIIGKGASAEVFAAEDDQYRKYAIRIVKNEYYKFEIHLLAQKYRMAPTLFYQFIVRLADNDYYTIIIMDMIQGTLEQYLKNPRANPKLVCSALECILDKKYLLKFLHGDFHIDNIVVLKDGETLGLIDFDFSVLNAPDVYVLLDFIPLIPNFITRDPKRSSILRCLLKYYKKTYNMTINLSYFKFPKNNGVFYEFAKGKSLNSYMGARKDLLFPISWIKEAFPDLSWPEVVP